MIAPVLTTERLTLRPFQPDDVEALVREITSDAETMTMLFEDLKTEAEQYACAQRYMNSYTLPWKAEGYGGWAVCDRVGALATPGALLGFCGFEVGELTGAGGEFGYGYSRQCHRKGIGMEAASRALEWYFAEGRFEQLYACIRPQNTGSQKILERLGLVHTRDEDLWHSVAKGIGKLLVFTQDRETWMHNKPAS
jgi:[ribosomal protein S5]-alanine N-acetyltransferase